MKRSVTLFLTAIAMTLASCGEAIHPSRVKATFVNYDDTTLFVTSVEYGGTAAYQGDTPTRPTTADSFHYVFDGWDLPLDGLKEDTTFIAQYKEETNQYVVEFKNWDDELLETTYVLHGGDVTYTGEEPTRPRTQQFTYSFSGWDKPLTNITSSQTLHAQFEEEVNQYTVTFKNEDGSVLAVSTVDYGGTAEYRGKTPTKESTEQYHYAFAGWDIPLTNITEDCEATAQFESSLNEFTVTFLNYDGDELGVDVVKYGGTAVYSGNEPLKPKTPQYSYLFSGWNKSLTNITADTEVTATFEEIVNRYTVTFINDDGTRLGSDEVEYGGTAVYPNETPTIPATAKYSYEFIGWDKPLTNITEDCERYAQYRSSVNTYKVVFKNYDDSILSEETVQYGDDAYYHGPTPEKGGNQQCSYHFIGWDVSLNGVTHDIVAIAQYVQVVNQYTVTFKNYDGSTLGACTVDYGSPASYDGAEPTREADSDNTYQFNGWDISLEHITSDCVATAQYLAIPIIKDVEVTFKITVHNLGTHTVGVVGSLNNWALPGTPLTAEGNDVYSFSYTAKVGTTIEYKYVLDGSDWDSLNTSNRTFTYTTDITEKDDGEIALPAGDLTPISELISADTDTEFTTHAYVVGISSGTFEYTPSSGSKIDEYKYVYIADGEYFLQGFNVPASDLEGIAVGDVVEVEGEVSQYDKVGEGHWVTPDFSSRGFKKVEDDSITAPVFKAWDAEHPLGTIAEADINKGYVLTDAIVTSISTSSKGHTTINLMIGEETATLYLRADSKDNAVEGFSNVKAGWRISGKTWVGVNYNQDGFQFTGLNDATFTEGTLPDQDITALADVMSLEKDATFQSRAKVVGIPDKTEELKDGTKVWKYVLVADGATFYQLYQVPEGYMDGISVGDYIEFKGAVADYKSTWNTKEASVSEKVKKLESAGDIAEPVFKAWDSEHALGTIVEGDVNKGVAITDADITAVNGSNITLKIGSETIGVYLRANSYNLPIEKVVAGNKLSAKAFIGHNKGVAQFIHLEDISVKEVDYPVESVEVASNTAEIGIGGTYQIEASVLPALADQSLTYTVASGSDYIEVTDAGLVTGKAAGEGVVTVASVKDPAKTATVTVTVKDEATTSWSVTKTPDQYDVVTLQDWSVKLDDNVTFAAAASTIVADSFRINKGKTATVSVPTGYVITKIVLTCLVDGTTKFGPGCFGAGAPEGYTYEGKVGAWTGSLQTVSFTATDAQVRAASITVEYSIAE